MSGALAAVGGPALKGAVMPAKPTADSGASFAPALQLARDVLEGTLSRPGAGPRGMPGPTPPTDPNAWGSVDELTPIPSLSLMLGQTCPVVSPPAGTIATVTAPDSACTGEALLPTADAGGATPEISTIGLAAGLPVNGGTDLLGKTGVRLTPSAHAQIPGPVTTPAVAGSAGDGTTTAGTAPRIALAGAGSAITAANTPGAATPTDTIPANTPGVVAAGATNTAGATPAPSVGVPAVADAARVPASGAPVVQSTTAPAIQPASSGQVPGTTTEPQAGPATQATPVTPASSATTPVGAGTGSLPGAVAVAQPATVRGAGIDREASSSGAQLQPAQVAGALPVQQAPATLTAAPAVPVPSVPAPQHAPLATQLYKPVFSLTSAAPGEHLITVRVAPDELGPVTVRAVVTAEGMRVELFAPTDTAREALRGMLPDLRRDLATPGLNASLDVSTKDPSDGGPAGGDPDWQDPARRDRSHHLPVPPGSSGGIPPDDPATRSGRLWWNQSTLDLLA
ncbi:flagellar hook-length control protein FliK [Arthrobacter sp. CAN_A1]|uniref:flagellar hook-length control protein FliK n=1 Tax=Arthrobacter sp. CAN_A1 TaxID=2787717 RepID=UPI001A35467F